MVCGREISLTCFSGLGQDGRNRKWVLLTISKCGIDTLLSNYVCGSLLDAIWTYCVSVVDVRRMHNFVRGGSSRKHHLSSTFEEHHTNAHEMAHVRSRYKIHIG